jgi:UDP-glucose 4-epimerase
MKVLMTGALGYLGSVMLDKWATKSFDVSVFDSIVYGNFLPSNTRFKLV